MSAKNRGDRIQLLQKVVKKYYKPMPAPEGRSVLEHVIYASCLEDALYEAADEAFHRLQESYFDWNEVRVTTVSELCEVLANLPEPAAAATRVKKNLQSIFEARYSFDIEDMVKMNQGKAIQELEKFSGMSKFVLGYTTQHAFGGHAIPISQSIMNVLLATEIVTPVEAEKWQVPGLERTIPKSKGLEFASCLHQLAVDCKAQPNSKSLKGVLREAGAPEPKKAPPPKPPKKEEPKKATKEPAAKESAAKPTKASAKPTKKAPPPPAKKAATKKVSKATAAKKTTKRKPK